MRAFDLLVALSLLTRLPAPIDHAKAGERVGAAVWAYPIAGLVIGAICGGALWALSALGMAAGPAAALALAVGLAVTGALHEDGLADAADGLGGGADRARALEIMRDSRIGAYGAAALTLALLARWSALSALLDLHGPLAAALAFAAAAAASRSALAMGLALWPSARGDGLSAEAGRAPPEAALLAVILGLAAVIALTGAPLSDGAGFGGAALLGWGLGLGAAAAFLAWAARRLGGQTGDVLGAAQQIAEIVFLSALTAA